MFNDNWFLFLLIIMLVFLADGNISGRECAVLLSIVFALAITNNSSDGSATTNCFCNRDI